MPSRSTENAKVDSYNQKNYRLYNMHLAPMYTSPCRFIFLLLPQTRANGVRVQL